MTYRGQLTRRPNAIVSSAGTYPQPVAFNGAYDAGTAWLNASDLSHLASETLYRPLATHQGLFAAWDGSAIDPANPATYSGWQGYNWNTDANNGLCLGSHVVFRKADGTWPTLVLTGRLARGTDGTVTQAFAYLGVVPGWNAFPSSTGSAQHGTGVSTTDITPTSSAVSLELALTNADVATDIVSIVPGKARTAADTSSVGVITVWCAAAPTTSQQGADYKVAQFVGLSLFLQ